MNRKIMKRSGNKVLKTPAKKLDYLREYRKDDHALEHDREWLNDHPDYMREWHVKHPGYRRLKSKDWRMLHRNYSRTKSKEWRITHPVYYVQYRQRNNEVLKKYWRNYKQRRRSQNVGQEINQSI